MLTRSKCMAASEAAGEKNREMERVSDTFHPPTTVVATPDPIYWHSQSRRRIPQYTMKKLYSVTTRSPFRMKHTTRIVQYCLNDGTLVSNVVFS